MDIETVRYNERFKAIAGFCDNAALAFFVASVARAVDGSGDILAVVGVVLGIAFIVGAWHIRGLIELES